MRTYYPCDIETEVPHMNAKSSRRKALMRYQATDFPLFVDYTDEVLARVSALAEDKLKEATAITEKADRRQALSDVKAEVLRDSNIARDLSP